MKTQGFPSTQDAIAVCAIAAYGFLFAGTGVLYLFTRIWWPLLITSLPIIYLFFCTVAGWFYVRHINHLKLIGKYKEPEN